MNRKILIGFIGCLLLSSIAFAQEKVTTVLIVRHAEKSRIPPDDPVLNAQGKGRAELLARMFENAGITAIFTSQYARTKLTAEPLARKIGISAQIVDATSSRKLADAIRTKHAGETVLVVGHSNTIPEIIEAFGGKKMEEMPETDYDNLYVLTLSGKTGAKLLPVKFFIGTAEQVCQ